jgi:Ferritin-like
MAIHTREELINNIVAAAELEHALMVQYLYAAMTLKSGTADGLTPTQVTMVTRWRRWILGVARQEMGHLGTALNLLEAIGGGSHLDRMRLPSATGLYTPPIRFSLEPLTLEAIGRFVQFETPTHQVAVQLTALAPDPVVVEHVGQLYGDIKTAIDGFTDAELFIGRGSGQDSAHWSFDVVVMPVTDRATAHAAIDAIIVQGEGNSTGADDSHFGRFTKIVNEYKAECQHDPAFQPHRDVVANPATLPPPTPASPDTTVITDAATQKVAELFSACYTTLLLTLVKHYRFEETSDSQEALRGVAKGMMMNVLSVLGPFLSRLTAGPGLKHAGPPFEIYTLPSLPNDRAASLIILRERITAEKAFAAEAAAAVPLDGVLDDVAGSLGDILAAIPQ